MADPQEEIHIRDTEATGASKEGVGRWVLGIGTGIAVLLLGGVALFGGLSQGDIEEEATVSGKIQSAENDGGSDTDQVLTAEDGATRSIESGGTSGSATTSDTVPNSPQAR